MTLKPKPVIWLANTKKILSRFPADVRDAIGFALFIAQGGGKHPDAKPMVGFGGARVLEICENFDGNTYRAVYTVKLAETVYVLHIFQKKAKTGIATPKAELDLIKARLAAAEEELRHARKI